MLGYASERPIASNASESGKAQNRRVEVLILPSSVRTAPVAESAPAAPRRSRAAATPALNKDSAALNMNK